MPILKDTLMSDGIKKRSLTCTSSPKVLQGINWKGSKDLKEGVRSEVFIHIGIQGCWEWMDPSRSPFVFGDLAGFGLPLHLFSAQSEFLSTEMLILNHQHRISIYTNVNPTCCAEQSQCVFKSPNLISLSFQVFSVTPVSPYVPHTPLPGPLQHTVNQQSIQGPANW